MKKKNLLLSVALLATCTLFGVNSATTWSIMADTSNGLPSTASGRLIWGDVNNDGYKDAFIISGQGGGQAGLFKNNGDGTFSKIQDGTFTGLSKSSAVFIDYDNDGDLDLITTGKNDANAETLLVYENSGATGGYAFAQNAARSAEIKAVYSGDNDSAGRLLTAVDYDNDGWIDIMISGATDNNYDWITETDPDGWGWRWRFTAVYKNNQGSFQRKTDIVDGGDFVHATKGSIHAGDVNGDGYADFIAQGYSDYGYSWNAKLYINNKNGTFSISPYSSQLNGNEQYESVLVDVSGDGFADIVEISRAVGNIHISDGLGSFVKYTGSGLYNTLGTSISAGDINNDGLVDILVSGMGGNDGLFTNSTRIYYNNGDGTYNPTQVAANMQARSGSVALVDIDGDGNLDYSNFGYGQGWTTVFAKNTLAAGAISANATPTVPSNFAVQYQSGKFIFSWDASTDDITPAGAIRYNVFAKNNDTGKLYAYAPVDTLSGKLKVGGDNVSLIYKNSFELNFANGNYTFGVQAVDQAESASGFIKYNYLQNVTNTEDVFTKVKILSNRGSIAIQNNSSDDLHYSIISVSGKLVEEGKCNSGSKGISTQLNQGIYLVKLSQNKSIFTAKIPVF